MLVACTGTTFLTVLSMSAIATNGKIRTGGVYFLVSRSLGSSTGASIGILYYLATTFQCALNILGAVETLEVSTGLEIGPSGFSTRLLAVISTVVLVLGNFLSIKYVSKTGAAIIVMVFICVLSMLLGLLSSRTRSEGLKLTVEGLNGLRAGNFRDNFSS